VQWILANVVFFRTQLRRELTLDDLIVFLKRTKWKMYQRRNGKERVGKYLTIIDTEGGGGGKYNRRVKVGQGAGYTENDFRAIAGQPKDTSFILYIEMYPSFIYWSYNLCKWNIE
jgi:hypothetical protein